jgi:predicted ATPase/class 3 adenylate cyclase
MIKCETCRFVNPDRFAYCGRCGNWLSNSDETAETFDSTTIEGERKQVTVIFADISGFTALNDAAKTPADVERVIQIANHCLDMLSEVVYEYDGYIDKYIGDSIMAIFGAPRTHEDDPERALRAALAMQERLEVFNRHPPFPLAEPLGIHMGINTGTVIAGLIGSKRKRSYTVMGDTVNVASRLEGVSERGEFLVSQDTYNLTNRLFNFKEREPVFVKGKKEALRIYELVGAKSQRTSQRGISGLRAPMVGREKEFGILRQQIKNLKKGVGGINVIIGEAGLGKSRLASELQQETARENPDILWFEGRGLSFQQHLSYRLFIEILRQFLGVGADEPGEVAWHKWQTVGADLFGSRQFEVIPYLATLMGIKLPENITQNMPLSDPILLQQRIFLAIGEWLETIVAQQPMVLVFEDLHWADSNSVNLIEYLITISKELPLLIICISRPERESDFWLVKDRTAGYFPERYTELNLVPLNKDQSRFLVDRLLSVEQLPDVLEYLIFSRSEGNPLFMEEVLRSLIEDGTLVKKGETWTMARSVTEINIPDTLTGVLTARIDRLDEPVKRTLQIASVIGRVFHRYLLAAVMEDSNHLDEYLEALLEAELIRERPNDFEKEYIFKHVLIQEAAYNNLLLQQRRSYHKQIADYLAQLYWIRGEEFASTTAHHYEQSETWKRAVTYLMRAAEASKNAFDNVSAVNFYTRALDTSAKVENLSNKTLLEIYEGRGNLVKRLGKIDQAKADFEQILQLAGQDTDPVFQMRALSELGKLQDGYHNYNQVAQYFERALEIARMVEDKPGIVDTLNELGEFHINMGQLTQAKTYLDEALEIATELGNKQRITSSQNGLATILLHQGNTAASIKQFEELAQTWRNLGDYQGLMRAYIALTRAYTFQANYAKSDEICRDAMEILERFGDMNWVPQFRYYLAYSAFARGHFDTADAHIKETIETAQKLGKGIWHAIGLAYRGYYHLRQGLFETALLEIQQAVEMAEAIGSPLWTSRIKIVQGIAHRYNNNLAEAETTLTAIQQNIQTMGFLPDEATVLSELLEVYIAAGVWDKIPAKLERLQDLAILGDVKAYQAKALFISAQLANYKRDYEATIDLLAQAKNIVEATGDRLIEFAVKTNLAHVLSAQGQLKQAQTILQQAKKTLLQMADAIADEDRRQNFLSTYQDAQFQNIQNALDTERV